MLNKDRLTLYVDVENLMDIAKEAISSVFEQWPEEFPQPGILRLYVRADQVELWRVWAADKFPSLDIGIVGVQHYAANTSKNSADIALALDAITDLLKERTTRVAILSDDSDFATLFVKIGKEFFRPGSAILPFLWFMTDRTDTRSSILDKLFPPSYVRTVACGAKKPSSPHRRPQPSAEGDHTTEETSIAEAIIRNIPVGPFKSADCIKIVKQHFPEHSLTRLAQDHANFGTQFTKLIWPVLESYGVRLANPNKKPRRYEMTEEAKRKVTSAT